MSELTGRLIQSVLVPFTHVFNFVVILTIILLAIGIGYLAYRLTDFFYVSS